MGEINFVAVVVAAISTFLIGGLWWSPLMFQNAWMKVNGFRNEDLQKGNMAKIFGLSFLFSLLMAANLAAFLADPMTDLAWGATAGALTGVGWILPSIAVIALFERRPARYTLINGGYWAVSFIVMGAILGSWR